MTTSKASKPYVEDLMIWKYFLEEFNGITHILDPQEVLLFKMQASHTRIVIGLM
jgi:hypothetical protein